MKTERPTRVAIIGGGCAGMTAAYELTRPELEGRFDVTVYQQGWRLGGKGASGRGPFGRIEEHGLHIWMGFYENAFRLMRSVYDELGRDPSSPIATWRDAFFPASHIGLADWNPESDWKVWSTVFPPLPGLPGDPLGSDASNPFSVLGYLVRATEVTRSLFRVAYGRPERVEDGPSRYTSHTLPDLLRIVRELPATALGAAGTLVGLIDQRLDVLGALLRVSRPTAVDADAESLLTAALAMLQQLGLPTVDEQHRRRASEAVEVILTAQLATLRSGALTHPRGFDILDAHDFADWLRLNGASERAVNSSFLRGLYCLMFAYEDGDFARPRAAAGQALRGLLRMFFTYRGAFFWKMRAGMGDVVFAPLYEVCRRRGVDFQFFHRLTDVVLNPPEAREHFVSELRFLVQAKPREAYQPLVDVRGVPSWPSEPDWSQLDGGERMRAARRDFESHWDLEHVATKELRVGEHFDFVLLAVGLGAVPHVCKEIVRRDPRWRLMTEHLKTVATQALQLWTHDPMPALGWDRGPVAMTAFVSPFDTWADMTYLLDMEEWPTLRAPSTIAYFCNVLDERQVQEARPNDPGHPERVKQTVLSNSRIFLERDLPRIWPLLKTADGQVRWETLADHEELSGGWSSGRSHTRLASQFWTGNVNPSDRYVLCLPGTPQYRISPLDRTYDNFTIAGDWTSCGLNLGCVEAAVMSGMLASHALSNSPSLDAIIGYHHP